MASFRLKDPTLRECHGKPMIHIRPEPPTPSLSENREDFPTRSGSPAMAAARHFAP
jgi:hypothetical protein